MTQNTGRSRSGSAPLISSDSSALSELIVLLVGLLVLCRMGECAHDSLARAHISDNWLGFINHGDS